MRKHTVVTVVFVGVVVACVGVYGCAPQAAEPSSSDVGAEDSPGEAIAIMWSPESDCTMCHVREAATMADTSCQAGSHASRDVTCVTCHSDDESLSSLHDGVDTSTKVPSRLKTTRVSQETCTASGCHDDSQARIAATASVSYVADSTGRIANPHDLPPISQHEVISCADCHKGHKAVAQKDYIEFCYSCHHTETFSCDACHEI